jgi:hypothetical protein
MSTRLYIFLLHDCSTAGLGRSWLVLVGMTIVGLLDDDGCMSTRMMTRCSTTDTDKLMANGAE